MNKMQVSMNQRIGFGWLVGWLWLSSGAIAPLAMAQIIPDRTLPVNSIVTPGCTICTITGGTQRGVTLYHSFQTFSIPTGGQAWFNNAVQIQTILTRVTGNDRSNLDGLIKANGTANLFFLNPNGIVFGSNARLQMGGSFFASTASSVQFADGSEFSATKPQAPPLLAIEVSLGLQYGKAMGAIQQAGNLAVSEGKSLTLYGNTVTQAGTLTAPGGTVQILGDRVALLDHAQIDVSSPTKGGTVLIGGDYKGQGSVPNATQTYVGANVVIQANAQTQGNGGKVIVWANDTTRFYGNISAQGGTLSGDGGFVEVSGAQKLQFQGLVDTSATVGKTGTLLLDPDNITITAFDQTIPNNANDGLWSFTEDQGTAQTIGGFAIGTLLRRTSLTLQAKNTISFAPNQFFFINGDRSNTLTLQALTINIQNVPTLFFTGNLILEASTIKLENLGRLRAEFTGKTTFHAAQKITLTNSSLIASSGDITLEAPTIALKGGFIQQSNQGDMRLDTSQNGTTQGTSISIDNFLLQTNPRGSDPKLKGGDISITTGSLELVNGGQINTFIDTGNQGVAGNITIKASENLRIVAPPPGSTTFGGLTYGSNASSSIDGKEQNSGIYSTLGNGSSQANSGIPAKGTGGNIEIAAGSLSLEGNNIPENPGGGNAGIAAKTFGTGNAGTITIHTKTLSIINGGFLDNSTTSNGNAGSINITAPSIILANDNLNRRAIQSVVQAPQPGDPLTQGNGGDITLKTNALRMTKAAIATEMQSGTTGKDGLPGKAGDIHIQSIDPNGTVLITDGANLLSRTSGTGNAGRVSLSGDLGDIPFRTLTIEKGSQVQTQVKSGGIGNAGKIAIATDQAVTFSSDSLVLSTVEQNASGMGGTISINTGRLSVSDRAQLQVQTLGKGDAGNVTVNASTIQLDNQGQIKADTTSTGAGGSITLTGKSVSLASGAQVTASTSGSGQAGDIILNANDQITLSGANTGLFASTTPASTGKGGNILIDPRSLTVRDGAQIAVNSQGTGQGGNMIIQVGRLTLDHQGQLSAETASAQGGNITLDVQDLILLRHNSLISATAGTAQANGNGGNITITTPFIVGVLGENSDITANAFTGNGGKITINTNAIYGLQFQPQLTPFSDITASSQFGLSGTVAIKILNLDPSRGLTTLPLTLTDPSRQLGQTCASSSRVAKGDSRFIITGRGGLPSSPEAAQTIAPALDDLGASVTTAPAASRLQPDRSATSPPAIVPSAIVEAQGWITNTTGQVLLVTQAPQVVSHSPVLPIANCSP